MNFIITGTSNGIGNECVKILSTNSENKIIAISRNGQKLKELREFCENKGGNKNVYDIPFDLTQLNKNPDVLKSQVCNYFPKVDVLINNAGCLINKSFHEFTEVEINTVMTTNFIAPAQLIRLFIDNLEGGHVLNISSMGGFQGSSKYPGLSYYSASKSALACLTECLASEYSSRNIHFNCLALGAVQTEMLDMAFPGYQAPVSANDMAQFIADFAVNGAKYFNGKVIPVALSNP